MKKRARKNRWREGRQKALFWFLFLFFSSFHSVKYFLKIWANHFYFLTFKSFKPSLPLFLTFEGKRWIDLSFSLSARFKQLNTAQKPGIFKLLFLFHFVVIVCSLPSLPLSSRPLFLIALRNGVKNIHVRKAWFVTCIATENNSETALHYIIKLKRFLVCNGFFGLFS